MDVIDIDYLTDPVRITVQCPYCGAKDAIFIERDNFEKCSCDADIVKYLSPEDRDLFLRERCTDCIGKEIFY